MSIHTMADHELRTLVKWGRERFVTMAQEELKRRAARVEAPGVTDSPSAEAQERTASSRGPAFPHGRWTSDASSERVREALIIP